MNSFGSGMEQVVGSREHGNGPIISINFWQFPD